MLVLKLSGIQTDFLSQKPLLRFGTALLHTLIHNITLMLNNQYFCINKCTTTIIISSPFLPPKEKGGGNIKTGFKPVFCRSRNSLQ